MISRAVSGFFDGIYWILLIATAAAVLTGIWRWLFAISPGVHAHVNQPVQLASAIIAIASALALSEHLLPLRGISLPHWTYRLRPNRSMDGWGLHAIAQLLAFSLFGAFLTLGCFLGTAHQVPVACAVGAFTAMLRFACGFRNFTLANLLRAGNRREQATAGITLMDSDLAANALANHAMQWRAYPPTHSLWVLAIRRMRRRFYLPLSLLLTITACLACSNLAGLVAPIAFVVSWSISTAGLARTGNFSPLLDDAWSVWGLSLTIIGLLSSFGAGILVLVWQPDHQFASFALLALGMGLTAARRSRSAKVTSLSVVDTGGFGVSYSPQVTSYVLRGFALGFVPVALALANF